MKAVGAILAGIVITPLAAHAADLPSRAAPPVFVAPVVAPFSWTGFYLGADAGYGFGTGGNGTSGASNLSVPAAPLGTFAVTPASGVPFLSSSNSRRNGFVGGGQIGYNYQFGAGSGVVIGVEADFQYSALGGGSQDGGVGNGFGVAEPGGYARIKPNGTGLGIRPIGAGLATSGANVAFFNNAQRGPGDFLGTIRGRLGYAFDRVLIYGTGGFAYTNGRTTGTSGGFANGASVPAGFYTDFGARAAGAGVAPNATSNSNRGLTGYVVGGGVEYAIPTASLLNVFHSSAVTLRVEGLYFNLGHDSGVSGTQIVGVSNTGAVITGTRFSQGNNAFAVVRAGINFKFGTVEAPVVARY